MMADCGLIPNRVPAAAGRRVVCTVGAGLLTRPVYSGDGELVCEATGGEEEGGEGACGVAIDPDDGRVAVAFAGRVAFWWVVVSDTWLRRAAAVSASSVA